MASASMQCWQKCIKRERRRRSSFSMLRGKTRSSVVSARPKPGSAALNAPEGTLAIYAAAPDKIIHDRPGANSLFVDELIRELRAPNLSAGEVFNRTRIGVSRASNDEQVPWVMSSLVESFSLGGSGQLWQGPHRALLSTRRWRPPLNLQSRRALRPRLRVRWRATPSHQDKFFVIVRTAPSLWSCRPARSTWARGDPLKTRVQTVEHRQALRDRPFRGDLRRMGQVRGGRRLQEPWRRPRLGTRQWARYQRELARREGICELAIRENWRNLSASERG